MILLHPKIEKGKREEGGVVGFKLRGKTIFSMGFRNL